MFLKHSKTGDLIRVEDLEELFNPQSRVVRGRDQAGQEEQDAATYNKGELIFPSGESLPQCWTDANYRTS